MKKQNGKNRWDEILIDKLVVFTLTGIFLSIVLGLLLYLQWHFFPETSSLLPFEIIALVSAYIIVVIINANDFDMWN